MKHQDVQVVSAGTFVLTAVDQGAGAILPKTVMIPDLHRVAMVSGPKGVGSLWAQRKMDGIGCGSQQKDLKSEQFENPS